MGDAAANDLLTNFIDIINDVVGGNHMIQVSMQMDHQLCRSSSRCYKKIASKKSSMNFSTLDYAASTSYIVHSKWEQKDPDGIFKIYLKEYSQI